MTTQEITDQEQKARTPLIRRAQIIRLGRLLHMKYKPAEIAQIIGVTADTIYRSYLPAGAPYERDVHKNIWIIGDAFRSWVLDQNEKSKQKKYIMEDNQAWCLRCNKVTTIQNPGTRAVNRYITFITGICEFCGGKVNRATGQGITKAKKAQKAARLQKARSNDQAAPQGEKPTRATSNQPQSPKPTKKGKSTK